MLRNKEVYPVLAYLILEAINVIITFVILLGYIVGLIIILEFKCDKSDCDKESHEFDKIATHCNFLVMASSALYGILIRMLWFKKDQ